VHRRPQFAADDRKNFLMDDQQFADYEFLHSRYTCARNPYELTQLNCASFTAR
jgi:hypothetical protein